MPIIDERILRLYPTPSSTEPMLTLFWGDEVVAVDGRRVELGEGRVGYARKNVKLRASSLLKIEFIDVGQGDACLLLSPTGKKILVDGGESQRLARYFAKRFVTSPVKPLMLDAIVITHGDADHFDGLSLLAHEAAFEPPPERRAYVATSRVFHNGLVKRPTSDKGRRRRDDAMFGRTRLISGRLSAVELVDDIRSVAKANMNRPFQRWARALDSLEKRHAFLTKRLERGDDAELAFFDPDVNIQVLGPSLRRKGKKAGLELLRSPEGGISAAHTINGHSIVLRVSYGKFHALLAADLNATAEAALVDEARAGTLDLRAQVLKVPHHGSGDFAVEFLRCVRPTVSVVSAGDEDEAHEYIHPRSNLIGALGNAGHSSQPAVFVTDLAAFDRFVGLAVPVKRHRDGSVVQEKNAQPFYARERVAFGIVHVRTDGNELLVGSVSARKGRVEAYRYELCANGDTKPLSL